MGCGERMNKYIPVVLLILLIAAWAVFFDRTTTYFVFGPSRQVYSLQAPFKEVSFPTADKSPLHALYIPAQPGKPTLLFFHGNKHNIYSFQDFVLPFAADGYGVFLFDYRGFGKSIGKPSQPHMAEDARAALFDLMLKRKVLPKDMVLWGFGLGSYPALYVAAEYNKLPFKAVILQSPFTTSADMGFYILAQKYDGASAASLFTLLLKPILWNKNFDNLSLISQVKAPLFIGFSRADKTVPWTMSRALAAKAPDGTQQFFSEGGAHESSKWIKKPALQFLENLSQPAYAPMEQP